MCCNGQFPGDYWWSISVNHTSGGLPLSSVRSGQCPAFFPPHVNRWMSFKLDWPQFLVFNSIKCRIFKCFCLLPRIPILPLGSANQVQSSPDTVFKMSYCTVNKIICHGMNYDALRIQFTARCRRTVGGNMPLTERPWKLFVFISLISILLVR